MCDSKNPIVSVVVFKALELVTVKVSPSVCRGGSDPVNANKNRYQDRLPCKYPVLYSFNCERCGAGVKAWDWTGLGSVNGLKMFEK